MIHVKICGITNLEDALFSVSAGADALGFNFYRNSPRFVEPDTAAVIGSRITGEVSKVGVFVNETVDDTLRIAAAARVDTIQLHGDEDSDFVSELKARTNSKIIKAVRIESELELDLQLVPDADAFLFDVHDPLLYGGTGKVADWTMAARIRERTEYLYLAGGLTSENVADAISKVRPFAVDVASGVELEKGRKDPDKVIAFITNAKSA